MTKTPQKKTAAPEDQGAAANKHETTTTGHIFPVLVGSSTEKEPYVTPIWGFLDLVEEPRRIPGKRGTVTASKRCGPYFTAIAGGYKGLRHQAPEDTECGVIVLDIDEADGIDPASWDALGCHFVWRTFRSALSGPGQRWRVVLFVEGVTVGNYRDAADTLIRLAGVEGRAARYDAGHPMFVPCLFEGEETKDILVHQGLGGKNRAWKYRPGVAEARGERSEDSGEAWASAPDFSRAEVMEILWSLDPDVSYDQWYALGGAVKLQAELGGWSEIGREAWVRWSRCGQKGQDGSAEDKWDNQLGGHAAPATLRRWHASGSDAPSLEQAKETVARNLSLAFGELTTEGVGALVTWMGFGDPNEEGFAIGRAISTWATNKGWGALTNTEVVSPKLIWGEHSQDGWLHDHPEVRYKWAGLVGLAKMHGWLNDKLSGSKALMALKRTTMKCVATETWEPAKPTLFQSDYGLAYNFFRDYVSSVSVEEEEWDKTFAESIRTVVEENWGEKANWLLGWMRHVIMNPGEKSLVVPVLQGAQGIGKGTLYRVFSAVLRNNAGTASAWNLGFTNAFYRKMLVCFEEFPQRPNNDMVQWVKDCATAESLDHNLKYGFRGSARNHLNLMIHTNEIYLDLQDAESRRFCCLPSKIARMEQRSPRLLTALRVINQAAEQRSATLGAAAVRFFRALPATSFTVGEIPEGYSAYEAMRDTDDASIFRQAFEAMENKRGEKGDYWITGTATKLLMTNLLPDVARNPTRYSHAMRDAGFVQKIVDLRPRDQRRGAGLALKIWVISDHLDLALEAARNDLKPA